MDKQKISNDLRLNDVILAIESEKRLYAGEVTVVKKEFTLSVPYFILDPKLAIPPMTRFGREKKGHRVVLARTDDFGGRALTYSWTKMTKGDVVQLVNLYFMGGVYSDARNPMVEISKTNPAIYREARPVIGMNDRKVNAFEVTGVYYEMTR